MDYAELPVAERREMLRQRIKALETEHYQHTVNKAVQEALPPNAESENILAGVAASLAVIEAAHQVVSTCFAELGDD